MFQCICSNFCFDFSYSGCCFVCHLKYDGHYRITAKGVIIIEFLCNNNNILYSSHEEIKAVIRSHNEEHISVILSHETHAHTHCLTLVGPQSTLQCQQSQKCMHGNHPEKETDEMIGLVIMRVERTLGVSGGETGYYYSSLLYSAILRSQADSLRSHVILHE